MPRDEWGEMARKVRANKMFVKSQQEYAELRRKQTEKVSQVSVFDDQEPDAIELPPGYPFAVREAEMGRWTKRPEGLPVPVRLMREDLVYVHYWTATEHSGPSADYAIYKVPGGQVRVYLESSTTPLHDRIPLVVIYDAGKETERRVTTVGLGNPGDWR